MDKGLVEKVVAEAREAESNLIVSDRWDTFTVEKEDVASIEVADDHLKVTMQDGKAIVYLMLDEIYKLVVEKEKVRSAAGRAGFAVG
ncbi:Hypothetical Protein RradSPS_2153 [Rubrobacter radiotolerans]|uniref:Uncharacterized protein n=1 Tax=Rubrobacter radiotolerans TaxID=42256 RepID=A0A023X5F2_RUBRA|nr:hypothetical protein [Rubrobacter radiotolerans]AHY47436.1 Hypothetical Protein RradSPS_2153 [Rubrobacter radiotolerans]MDX5894839.1 hypothetical protein [Rubrobacter radiotolerans]SMC06877.1 conserved hypothetical protein [Rubrobacter radiotolerans DSM 5868]